MGEVDQQIVMQQLREDIHYLKEATIRSESAQREMRESQTKIYKLLMGGVDVDGVTSDGLVQRHQHVEAVLFGDPKTEKLGLSQRMNSMEETIENKKLKWRWLVGWAAGVGATIAAITEYLRGHEK